MDEPKHTRFDIRLRSVGYLLPLMGFAIWILGVGIPAILWLTDTPIFNHDAGQFQSPRSLGTILFGVIAAMVGTAFIKLGAAIRRAYQNGQRSGF